VLIAGTGPAAERLRVRQIDDDQGRRLARIVRRGSEPVVTRRRAQTVLLPAQGMDVAATAKVAFTSEDRVRDVIGNFNADGFGSLYPRHRGGRPPKFTPAQRREIKKIAKSRPAGHGLPFSTRSPAGLADFLVAEGVADDISHEGLRALLREKASPSSGPRRHRPRHPPTAGQHDPPLHHLAQQPRLRRTTPPHHRPGKRSLMRH
jgi:transposase